MGKFIKLLIVESPAKAKTIGKYLGKDFIVLASYGHIRSIPSRAHAVRPDMNFAIDYEITTTKNNKKTKSDEKNSNKKNAENIEPIVLKKHLQEIANAAKKSSAIYLAPDPDREGEAIAWHVQEFLKQQNILNDNITVYRVAFHSITKKAIEEAIENPRVIDMNLVKAQQARQALDYLVGFTISPILWRKLPGSRSAGRVQSVTLRMLCEREAEIRSFKVTEYWSIALECMKEDIQFKAGLIEYLGKKLGKHDLVSFEQTNEIVSYLSKENFSVLSVEKKQTKKSPNPPFTTSTLLQDSSRKLGFSSAKTSTIAQKLYEGVVVDGELTGIITYMRTDSVVISEDAIIQIKDLIEKQYGNAYLPNKTRVFKTKSKNAQEAHEAIRPTNPDLTPSYLKQFLDYDQFQLYELIWRRAVASQMSEAVFDNTICKITNESKNAIFRVNGRTLIFKGFYEVYGDFDELHNENDSSKKESNDDQANKDEGSKNIDSEKSDIQKLPILQENEELLVKKITPNQHFTQAPPRFNEASLVKKMEELGIGRPSTYSTIMSILQERNYAKIENKRFFTEDRGELVNAFLVNFFHKYVEYDFTANLENQLDLIACGEVDQIKTLDNFWQPFKSRSNEVMSLATENILHSIEEYLSNYIFENGDKICPSCKNGQLNLRNSKYGSYVSCSRYPDCSYKRKMHDENDIFISANATESSSHKPFPKNLGEINEQNVILNIGPYGPYIRLMQNEKQVKISSLPKDINIDSIDMEIASKILSLPKEIGQYQDHPLIIGIGRFGPYVSYKKKFYSVKVDQELDILNLSIEQAVILIEKKLEKEKILKKKENDTNLSNGKNINEKNIKVVSKTITSKTVKSLDTYKKSSEDLEKKKLTKLKSKT